MFLENLEFSKCGTVQSKCKSTRHLPSSSFFVAAVPSFGFSKFAGAFYVIPVVFSWPGCGFGLDCVVVFCCFFFFGDGTSSWQNRQGESRKNASIRSRKVRRRSKSESGRGNTRCPREYSAKPAWEGTTKRGMEVRNEANAKRRALREQKFREFRCCFSRKIDWLCLFPLYHLLFVIATKSRKSAQYLSFLEFLENLEFWKHTQ